MAPKKPLLEQMRANPRDWRINDVESLCDQNGVTLVPPSAGSHYKAMSDRLVGHQCIPANRPIKPVYIKALVVMIDAHIACMQNDNDRAEGTK